jgi:hypothetical protein
MGWLAVILFAVAAGAYTGIVGSIPAAEGTSFKDIAISFEWWVIFAVVIASNCTKSWESALKIFVFFLISQPLCFIIEVVFGLSVDQALYYCSIWGPVTLLTLPGGFIAYYINRQNVFGSVILGLGNSIQAFLGIAYIIQMLGNPPYHLLSAIVCFASVFIMTFQIQKDNRNRVISLLVPVVVVVAALVFIRMTGRVIV